MERGPSRKILIVVEDYRGGDRHFGPKLPHESSCESRHIRHEFRSQRGQAKFLPTGCGLSGLCNVMEKGGEIGVAGIHVVPQCPRLVLSQVTGHERRLTGSGRPGNPNQCMMTMVLSEYGEEALTACDGVEPGRSELGECSCPAWHFLFRYVGVDRLHVFPSSAS